MPKPKPIVKNAFKIYARLFNYVRRYWVSLLLAVIASMCYSGIDAWFVHFLEPLLNKGLVARNKEFLHWAPVMVLCAFLIRGVASFVSNYHIARVSRQVIMRLRQDLFGHLMRLPAAFYDRATSGQVLSIVLYSVEQVANASADVLTTAVQSLFLIVGLLYVMFTISWKLSCLYFIIIPCIAVIMRYSSSRVRRLSLKIQESMADITHIASENIDGYREVRTYGGQPYEIDKFDRAVNVNRQRELKVVASRALSVSGVLFVAALALSITLYVATFDIADSVLSPGGFVAMVAAMLALLKPIKDLTSVQNKLYRGLAGAQTVFEFLDQPVESDQGTMPLTRAKGKIEFAQVNFAYDSDKTVLHDVNLTVQPGEIVALVGRSGSGKSTFVSLLTRFYPNYTGQILVDDVSIHDYRLSDLRRQFALVSQHVTLFNDTIEKNIAYGIADINENAIIAAAKAANAYEFIQQLPQGFKTPIGENGILLSGGQRQRIAIARAILKNAPFLILDEATSALDTESERAIQEALQRLMHDRTTLVIAHRLSTVEHANKIVVFDAGRIIESGDHAALLASDGMYAKLYHMQFNEEPVTVESL